MDVEREAERLVETYADTILRLAFVQLGSTADAEDVCQTVLMRLLTHAPRLNGPDHERAWVIRTTINACRDLLRSAARRTTVALEAAGEVEAPPEPDGTVADAVSRLPRDQREAIHLHYYEGLPIAQVAQLVGASEAAVTKRLSRARETLRHTLGGES
ncbi:MAG: sigma-70 family RNA polymerase sigma factor [Atopobiaceae bacterium]|nr:sigma-70 family RNA polymerase sigma factor [Olsenella sp.]MBQ6491567.1 sigma-70 family RNA polymerase sigma factor [Atopobiaceae bacterium]